MTLTCLFYDKISKTWYFYKRIASFSHTHTHTRLYFSTFLISYIQYFIKVYINNQYEKEKKISVKEAICR